MVTHTPFKKLAIWQKAMTLVKLIYEATAAFPSEETAILTTQIRRCAISIPASIAQGSHRSSDEDFGDFAVKAKDALVELHTYALVAKDLDYLSSAKCAKVTELIVELDNMLHSFAAKLGNSASLAQEKDW